MTQLETFVHDARARFGAPRLERSNGVYIDVPIHYSGDCLPDNDRVNAGETVVVDPFAFLTEGAVDRRTCPGRGKSAVAPFIACIVGDYGLGKTELVHQLCDELWALHAAHGTPAPLAVNLAQARSRSDRFLSARDALAFAQLLFSLPEPPDDHFLADELLPAIRNGRVVLLLDGLDELIFSQQEHDAFFRGLAQLLHAEFGEPLAAKVVIGARLVYFETFPVNTGRDGDDRVALLDPDEVDGPMPSHHFLRLLSFREDDILSYLATTFGDDMAEDMFDKIGVHPSVLNMLSRPLLLALFCHLIPKQYTVEALIDLLLVGRDAVPAGLVEKFVGTASKDRLRYAQRDLGPYGWDLDKIDELSLEALRRRTNCLGVEQVREALVRISDVPADGTVALLTSEEVMRSVHKCPFFGQNDGTSVDFSHKIFFDYFVAKGVLGELKSKGDGFNAFDELVLPSIEMRQFLKQFMDEDKEEDWYKRTSLSYGFREWEGLSEQQEADYDEIRKTLLDGMTYPDDPPAGIESAVQAFLDLDAGHGQDLHPKYRMYNYEAVAVWLAHHRRAGAPWRPRFEEQLGETWDSLWRELADDRNPGRREAEELLLERVLDIGRRLYLRWAPDAATAVLQSGETVLQTEFTPVRMAGIAEEIKRIT